MLFRNIKICKIDVDIKKINVLKKNLGNNEAPNWLKIENIFVLHQIEME